MNTCLDLRENCGKMSGGKDRESRQPQVVLEAPARGLTTNVTEGRKMAINNSILSRLEKQLHIDGEIWKDVVGYEGVYEVSDHGRVRRVRTGLVLSPGRDKKGYTNVGLCVDGKPIRVKVHHLVMEAFVGKRPNGLVINHIDENPRNNHVSNLEYVTQSYNCTSVWENKRKNWADRVAADEGGQS